jgi:hypothetical protein
LWKTLQNNGNHNWVEVLQDEIKNYNDIKSSVTGMKPKQVRKKHEKMLLERIFQNKTEKKEKIKYKVGDVVRINRIKQEFEKGYTGNWSTELYKITKVRKTKPPTYHIEDMNGQIILGVFYNQELARTRFPDIYLVERVIRYKDNGNKAYVKWLGFKKSSWVNTKDIL